MDDAKRERNAEEELGRTPAPQRVEGDETHEGNDRSPIVDELIINVLNGTSSRFDGERLRRWREAAPQNEAHYQELAGVWALTAPEPVVPASGPPPVEDIVSAAPAPFLKRGSEPRRPGTARTRWIGFGLLAASVAAVALGIRMFPASAPDPIRTYRAAEQEDLTVTLEDGSFVRLAAGSSLREWAMEGSREVSLDGRGFFAVARDEARPFVVRAGGGEVRVLGTRFQVESRGGQVRTLVVEGLVNVSTEEGTVDVPAGSMATFSEETPPSAQKVDDVLALMDWPDGTLIYQATPLSQVVNEVSRHYGRMLRIDAPALNQRRVTAWFQGESFEAVAESLCLVTEATCRPQGEDVVMGFDDGGGIPR